MKVCLIYASPKAKESTSEVLIHMLKKEMGEEESKEYQWNQNCVSEEEIKELLESEVIVLAFPLYVDSLPSHLLRNLIQIEKAIKRQESSSKPKIYGIVNAGFFEGKQTLLAMECIKNWSKKCRFTFAGGIGIGGGGMIKAIQDLPNQSPPKKRIHQALKQLAENILQGKEEEIRTIDPQYPKLLYKLQAEHGWRIMAKRNGLKRKDLDKKW